MNLALHGLMLQVIVSMVEIQSIFRVCSAGEPGYLDFDNLPETNFSCQGKVIGGYYADIEAGCQMFHVCTIGQKDEIMDIKFLCLNGTVFDQETRVCERVDEVDCSKSERFYNLNLELYGNNAVTLSLHEGISSSELESSTGRQENAHSFYTTTRPNVVTTTVTTTTTSTTPRSTSSTPSNKNFRNPSGFQHQYYDQDSFQPTVPSIYNDKHDDYRHQYVFHNSDRSNKNSQATSYQLFSSNQPLSSTASPNQIQQLRYSQSSPQAVRSESFTISPLGHGTSTVQSLLKGKKTGSSLINPIFHNHALSAGPAEFSHNNNPRETLDYEDEDEDEEEEEDVEDNEEEDLEGREAEKTQMNQEQNHGRRNMERKPLDPIQSTSQGKVSKLSISPVPQKESTNHHIVIHSEEPRITLKFLKPTGKPSQVSTTFPTVIEQKVSESQQAKLNQRVAQNPPPLLPSQSRVIVTAKASVSDESGRPLNTSQIIALPTVPSNYDDYKEGDESFDPFYKDVPKIHNQHITKTVRVNQERSGRRKRSAVKVRVTKINAKRNDLRLESTMPTKKEQTPAEPNSSRNRTGNKKSSNMVGFNCLDKELYRFYSDARDCRLFHYCSPGFTNRQVLDFRFVCEKGTLFDETSQSCRFADCKRRL